MTSSHSLSIDALVESDRRRVWHPYAPMPTALPPVPVVDANGCRLTLGDGRQVIDGMSSWWAAIHGYRHPVLDAAAAEQMQRMAHVMFGGITHHPAVELAELLVELSPGGLEHVFFSDSGSVSVEVAIKMAIQYWAAKGQPSRHRMLAVRNAYHGDTLACMSVCDPVNGMHHMFAGLLPQQLFAPTPSPAFGAPFEPSDIAEFERLLIDRRHELAAVIIEPIVQGAGGMRMYSPDYLAAVRRLCDEHDVLLIADEIATGFARSGTFFACEHADVRPDIMCVGKAMTGGYMSMAATLCTTDVASWVSRAESGALMHGPTYMGNPLAAAVAAASIRLLTSTDWRANIARIERQLTAGLQPARASGSVVDVRVLGAIGVVQTVEPWSMATMQRISLDHGVWLRPFGTLVYTMPPYICSDDEVAAICAAVVAAATCAERDRAH